MTFSSHHPSVRLFHSLGSGTMKQTLNQRNSPRNMGGTFSLKALANKVLERNKQRNKYGTMVLKSVPPMLQSSFSCGTNGLLSVSRPIHHETLYEIKNRLLEDISLPPSLVLEDYEERLAIAEHDGQQTPLQAGRIAYQDAFIDVLNALPQEVSEHCHGNDWLDARISAAKEWLESQNLF